MANPGVMQFGNRIPDHSEDPLQGFDVEIEDTDNRLDMGRFTAIDVDYETKEVTLTRGLLKRDLLLLPIGAEQEIPTRVRIKFMNDPRSFVLITPGVMRLSRFVASAGRTVVAAVFKFQLLDLTMEIQGTLDS